MIELMDGDGKYINIKILMIFMDYFIFINLY